MPGTDGYLSWDADTLRGPCYLNGVALLDSQAIPVPGWNPAPVGTRFGMADGGHVQQYQYIGGNAPLLGRALEIPIQMQHNREDDYWRMKEAEAFGPHRFWFGLWLDCSWYIPGRNAGQTTWKTDRRLPYGLPGITHATHPPVVLIDGVEQDILTSGTPGAGEVVVPEAGGFASLVAPAGITGEMLVLRCPFELLVTIEGPSNAVPQPNLWTYTTTLREHLGSGDYTGATA